VLPPCAKADRYDFNGEPLKTCFNVEVMRALGSRGGALWLRFKEAEAAARAQDEPQSFGDMMEMGGSLTNLRSHVSSEKLTEIFGLPPEARVTVNRSVIEKVFDAMQNRAKESGVEKIDVGQFFSCCVAAGFNLEKKYAEIIFKKIDTDDSGGIDAKEWHDLIMKAAT
jgi:hypothetical protein